EDGLVFLRKLHSRIEQAKRNHFQGRREFLMRGKAFRLLCRDVSLRLGLRVGVREKNGVAPQFAKEFRKAAFRKGRGEKNVGVEKNSHRALRHRSFLPASGASFI